jgi:hypothetical protein
VAGVLEAGEIHFFFRPRVEEGSPAGLGDVQQFLVVLVPRGTGRFRLLRVGRKRLPDAARHERVWAYVEAAGADPAAVRPRLLAAVYDTATRGTRHQPAARPVGEGVYALLRGDRDTQLAYLLVTPAEPGPVQHELNVTAEARLIVSVRNPEAATPADVGLSPGRRPELPADLQARFGTRRWAPVDPPALLDIEGVELLLIAVAAALDPALTGALEAEERRGDDVDVFDRLRLDRDAHPIVPLLAGDWG